MIEPVVVNICAFLRFATNHNRGLGTSERIVMNLEPSPCGIGPVLSISTAVHIKAMRERMLDLHVVSGFVPTGRSTRAGNRVAVVVEQVVFDQRKRLVVTHAVTQPIVLVVVDEVVMDVVFIASS